jgi:predicted aminopeptidase
MIAAGACPKGAMLRSLLLLLPLLLGGCFQAHYLGQAAGGQAELLLEARPLPLVLRDERVPGQVRQVLARVPAIKAYGQSQGLEPTRNYERYSQLHRSAAVWVVQGCAPLAFEAWTWSFPVVGSVPYLGFFDEARARRYAQSLAEEQGLDVTVRTASAYSTLGWFNDPVLSTMVADGPHALGELANTVLHESVHATVYINGQSTFDESLASFVADRLTLRWLVKTLGPGAPQTRSWLERRVRSERTLARLQQGYQQLSELYASGLGEEEKRERKAQTLSALSEELGLTVPLNNADLSGYRTYGGGRAAFQQLLQACGGDMRAFLGAVGTLRESDFSSPQQENFDEVIERLAARGCPKVG